MVNRLNVALQAVSDWGDANPVTLNATKTQACLFSTKRSQIHLAPTFRCVSVPLTDNPQVLSVELSSNRNFRQYIESKAQIAGVAISGGTLLRNNCFNCIKDKFVRVWSTIAIFGMVQPNTNWRPWTRLKSESGGSSVILP